MKLGIDARPLSPKPTGIGRYTEEIVLRLENQIDCELFSDKEITTQLKKVHLHAFSGTDIPKRFKKSVIWQQLLLPRVLKKAKPDLFWSPRHHLPLLGCKEIPMVLTIHDLVYRKMPETMKRSNWMLEKILLAASVKRADHIIAISHATKQALIEELNTPENKITVIHSGYVKFTKQPKIDLTILGINKPFILFLGSMEPRKNIDRLLSAYLALPKELQDQYQLVLAGSKGWKSDNLFKRINALPQEKVIYLGYVDDTQIYNLYKQAKIFAFPSLYEGFGLPILEAMSLGCPVLTSTDSACTEVAGDAAIVVDPVSIEAIAEGLKKALTDSLLCGSLIQKAYENIKRFSWDTAAQQHLSIFTKFSLQSID